MAIPRKNNQRPSMIWMLMFLNSAGEIVKTQHGAPICTMNKLTKEEFSSYLDKALANLKNSSHKAYKTN